MATGPLKLPATEVVEIMGTWRRLDDAERTVRQGSMDVGEAANFYHVSERSLSERFIDLPAEPF